MSEPLITPDLVRLGVEVTGDKHAVIHPDYDRFDNSGYVLESGGASVYHPGDALTPPGRQVDVLLAPVSAPWLKVSEAIPVELDHSEHAGSTR